MTHSIAIITVVYKQYNILTDFFSSLEKQTQQQYHIFLADVSEKDRQDIAPRDTLTLITTENKGYAHGVNMGLRVAHEQGYTHFIIINSDVIFDSLLVENTIRSLNIHKKSIIGGKIYYAPGYEYHTDRYAKKDRGNVLWYAGGTIDWDNAYTHHRGVDTVDTGQYDMPEKTEFITGCFMAFDEEVFTSVGYWDESYFMYYEDADFCERAKRADVSLYYDPSIKLWHKNAQSSDGPGSAFHVRYQDKNRLSWGLRYAPWRTKIHLVKNAFYTALTLKYE